MSRIGLVALAIGATGLAASFAGWMVDTPRFFAGWLSALVFVVGWPLGSMALLMIHALTGGAWGDALRPALRTGVAALPVPAIAAVPLMWGLQPLYPWARAGTHIDNAFYLNTRFFACRGLVYLLVWSALALLVWRERPLPRIAPVGLFMLALTVTFASVDATMSLDPHFTSSIYGMVAGAGMVLLALSAAVLLSVGSVARIVRPDFGKLLLALVVLWIYLDFMQVLIVWQSNLAKEAVWYLARSRGFWGGVGLLVALGHFLLPFALLLRPSAQASQRIVASVCGLLIAMALERSWWIVLPSIGFMVDWIDVACAAALGGTALTTAIFIGAPRVRALRHA